MENANPKNKKLKKAGKKQATTEEGIAERRKDSQKGNGRHEERQEGAGHLMTPVNDRSIQELGIWLWLPGVSPVSCRCTPV